MNILIHWKEEYSLNIHRIDEQHKKLIDMINVLHNSLSQNEKDDILDQVISDMIDYSFIHFRDEEKYFIQFGYENATEHILEHQYFLKNAEKLRQDHSLNDPTLKYEVVMFLQKWFTNHIMHSDKKYQDCFINGGLK